MFRQFYKDPKPVEDFIKSQNCSLTKLLEQDAVEVAFRNENKTVLQ